MDKHSSLLRTFVNYGRKKFYNIGPWCKQKMTSFRGQARWAKMTPAWGKLTALVCHPTKEVYKAE